MKQEADLVAKTKERFPAYRVENLNLQPILLGGSGRSYYRLRHPQKASGHPSEMIVMHYTTERPDNEFFVPVTRYLMKLGVAIPDLFGWDREEEGGVVWLEDLGNKDLQTLQEKSEPCLFELYHKTLEEAAKLHQVEEQDVPCQLSIPFTEGLYHWEQNYFAEHFLGTYHQLSESEWKDMIESPLIRALGQDLAKLPKFLIHRDLQSQNVMVRGNQPYLIDYQGLRWGRPEYDLASLLWDPYVDLSTDDRHQLLKRYYEKVSPKLGWEDFEQTFYQCSVQRLMQALGAYGNLGVNKELRVYFDFIEPASQRLREVLSYLNLQPSWQEYLFAKENH